VYNYVFLYASVKRKKKKKEEKTQVQTDNIAYHTIHICNYVEIRN